MKLRNKRTGVVADVQGLAIHNISFDLYDKNNKKLATDVSTIPTYYSSIAELNADWEDYTPKKPLIKDEKIRKAVRAWAGCNLLDGDDRVFLSKPTFDCKILSLEHGMLNFDVYYDDESLCNKEYTITELCGESEP